jgi:hypothetical protein
MTFSWYDPVQKELFKRTLKELRITVQPNPDLGVLASVRDSLLAVQAMALEETSEEEALTIGGLSPEQFALMLILAGFLAYILQVLVRKSLRMIKARRQGYRHSEAYYFHVFIKAAKGKHPADARQALYRWIDELKLHEPTIAFFARNYGSETLQEEAQALAGQGQPAPSAGLNISIKGWQQARNAFLSAKSDSSSERLSGWINPG